MKDFVPKGNHSPHLQGTSSGPVPWSNGALVTGGELDDTAQIGSDPTDQNAPAGDPGGADQLGNGYGYAVAPMLPGGDGLAIPNTNAGSNHPPAAAQPSSNQNPSADQGIAPPSPTGGQLFYFFDGADATVCFGGFNPGIVVSTGTGAITGSGTITNVGAGTLTLSSNNTYSGGTTNTGGTLISSNVGTMSENGQTTATVATADVSTTANVTLPISLLNQHVAGELVMSGAGSLQTVTAQAAPSNTVLFAVAPSKA